MKQTLNEYLAAREALFRNPSDERARAWWNVRRLCASNPPDRPAGDGPQSPPAMARRDGRHAGREPRVPVRLRLRGCSQHPRVHVKDPGRRAGERRCARARST
jgi:hypothetical protein